ncbi:patatin-like phospholipase family protein [Planctomycetota bacterium]
MPTSKVKSRRRSSAVSTVLIVLLGAGLLITGCAKPALNEPLGKWHPERWRGTQSQAVGSRSTKQLVLLAFSGGGTRAAAFSYGVLQELAQTQIQTESGGRTLLDEVDMISSVSGGSFTAAYYGLYGYRIFNDYEKRFLRRNVSADLLLRCARPDIAIKLLSPNYGKADMAATYYDKHLFEGATMADLRRPGGPLVIMNSTDLGTGFRFVFNRSHFDLICADLDSYPVSRAVTASSAVPVLFSPILLKNYAGQCSYETPAWMKEGMHSQTSAIRRVGAREMYAYLDPEKRPWLHLVDGGIADNLGLRSFYDTFVLAGSPQQALEAMGHGDVEKIVIISVNSAAQHEAKWPRKRSAPSLFKTLNSVSGVQIDRYTMDTIDIVSYAFSQWAKQLSTTERPVSFEFVEVSFEGIQDEQERTYLNSIGTNLGLSDEKIDHLIAAGRQVLRESSALKAYLANP